MTPDEAWREMVALGQEIELDAETRELQEAYRRAIGEDAPADG